MKPLITLFCCIGLFGCGGTNPASQAVPDKFPAVSRANVGTFNTTPCTVDPTSQTENRKSQPVNLAAGFSGHTVKVCLSGELIENVVFWSRTNVAGTNIEVVITTLAGDRYPQTADLFDQPNATNYFNFVTQKPSGEPMTCTIVKPAGGIAPAGVALCQV